MTFERSTGRKINHKKVRRIKRDFGLVTQVRKKSKFRAIFKIGEESKVAPNIVKRRFDHLRGRIVLATDITELRYAYGQRAYLAAVKDLRTKEIVSYKVSSSPTIELALADIKGVLEGLPVETRKRIIVHSDQGFQYTSHQYRDLMKSLGVKVSMSRKGNCLDNAPIESFFGHLKDEANHESCKSFKELRKCVQNYMHYYNYERPQWDLKKKTPAEAGVRISLVN